MKKIDWKFKVLALAFGLVFIVNPLVMPIIIQGILFALDYLIMISSYIHMVALGIAIAVGIAFKVEAKNKETAKFKKLKNKKSKAKFLEA